MHVWPGGMFCNKIPETLLKNIPRNEVFATCCRYWRHLATHTTAFGFFSENGFEHVKWPAQVENHRCSPGLRS